MKLDNSDVDEFQPKLMFHYYGRIKCIEQDKGRVGVTLIKQEGYELRIGMNRIQWYMYLGSCENPSVLAFILAALLQGTLCMQAINNASKGQSQNGDNGINIQVSKSV